MILLIDNYDSFTFNLLHGLESTGEHCQVVRNDADDVAGLLRRQPDAIVISPGPCTPLEAGVSVALIRAAAAARIPVLGVCLGHQAIGEAFGAAVVRAPAPMHGKLSDIRHDGTGLFAGLPNPLNVTRYHSLVVAEDTLPGELRASAHSLDDGCVMGLSHHSLPIHGVQFHPESIATAQGQALLANFVRLARASQAVAA